MSNNNSEICVHNLFESIREVREDFRENEPVT